MNSREVIALYSGIDRRRFLLTSVAGAFAMPRAAEAQQAPVPAHIAVFFAGSRQTAYGSERTWGPSFVAALRSLGWAFFWSGSIRRIRTNGAARSPRIS